MVPARFVVLGLFFVALAVAALAPGAAHESFADEPKLVADTPPRTPDEERKLFHLPPGFEIQLVAAEPDIQKPMQIAFDDRSRIWVTSSVEYPFPAKAGDTPRDSVRILEDTDGDGRSDRMKVFADGLNIPIGLLPVRGGCLAYSIPSIYRFTDRDGDDHADVRDVLYTGFGSVDTHGMSSSYTWGLDGWIYATHGFANNSEVKGSDGHVVKMNSGNTYRFRPDGSRIEQWTWGQVNPFGLAFDPAGNLFSADCHSRPIMMLLRGAYYQSFGKPDDGLGFGPEICTHEHGSTGIAGIVIYDADHFPSEYRNAIFTGNPVTNRINLDRLEAHGSTLQTVHQPDFLSCDDPWFRPVDLKLGPDGAIYIADFYNKIIGHYEVPLTHPGRDRDRGRIWRIVYTGPNGDRKPSAPRRNWETASVSELIEDLSHPNIVVRTKATNQLVERGADASIEPLRRLLGPNSNPKQRVHALWALERLGAAPPLSDPEPLVRVHAMRIAAERSKLQGNVAQELEDADASVRRVAADALARHPEAENIVPLLALRRRIAGDDTQLIHTVRMSLRDHLRADGGIDAATHLKRDPVDSGNLADVLAGVPTAAAAEWMMDYLQGKPGDAANFGRYLSHAARHVPAERLHPLFEVARDTCGDDLRRQAASILVLNESIQARGMKTPDEIVEWGTSAGSKLIETANVDQAREAIRLARALKLDSLTEAVTRIAAGQRPLGPLRADAISMLAEVRPERSREFLSAILGNAAEPLPIRQHVAASLGLDQRPEVQEVLIQHLRVAPEELGVHIAAALAGSAAGAEKLLDEIAAGKASARLIQHPLVNGRLRAARLPNVQERMARLTEGLPPVEEKLQRVIQARRDGYAKAQTDRERGSKLFEKHCANCHTIANRGAKIGPQLDGVAARGLDRLLEDVVDPNRNVDQAFRSSIIALNSGRVLSGLVLDSEGEIVRLADSQGQEVRIPKSDIDERTVSKLSPMPANVTDLMTEAEFYDLVSFLLSQNKP
jgi:putative heme-binding domain-containing protein